MPLFVIPGADFPPWAPFAFGLIGLATLAVLVWQAARYFRNEREGEQGDGEQRDDGRRDDDQP